jgi:hypothetical protein
LEIEDSFQIDDNTRVSTITLQITETPDDSLKGGMLDITFYKDKFYSIECEMKYWKKYCIFPLVGKSCPFETKNFVIEDTKIDSFYFFSYSVCTKTWIFGSLDTMTSYPLVLDEELDSKIKLGETKIKFLSQVEYIKNDEPNQTQPSSFPVFNEHYNDEEFLLEFGIDAFFEMEDISEHSTAIASSSSSDDK